MTAGFGGGGGGTTFSTGLAGAFGAATTFFATGFAAGFAATFATTFGATFAAGFAFAFGFATAFGFGVGFATFFGAGFAAAFFFTGFGGFAARFAAGFGLALFAFATTFRAGLRPVLATVRRAVAVFFACAFAMESPLRNEVPKIGWRTIAAARRLRYKSMKTRLRR
ncbi:MAG TPA: hypothetical protein VMU84_02890 [Thermoanaerobaculia bacterium]|nr:hypothetical protein [Thermoanaerobaculia bacterium]